MIPFGVVIITSQTVVIDRPFIVLTETKFIYAQLFESVSIKMISESL